MKRLTIKMKLAILATVIWFVVSVNHVVSYMRDGIGKGLAVGILPVLIGWGIWWKRRGFKEDKEEKIDKHDDKKEGFLGKPETTSRRANVGCLIIFVPLFCLAGWVGTRTFLEMRNREIMISTQVNLRSVLYACEKYWETDPTNDCSLPSSKQEQSDWGLNSDKVKISLINGQKGSFMATAKHYKSDTTFQIDNKGNTYIKVNDCLLRSSTEWLEASNEELVEECKKQELAKDRWVAERERIKKELEKNKMARSADGRFIDHGNGTITDTKTNLMWTKEDSYATSDKCLDWSAAISYASGLIQGGYNDWRIPKLEELKTIYEESKSNIFSDVYDTSRSLHLDLIFAGRPEFSYWSWGVEGYGCTIVDFSDGNVYESDCDQCAYQVVRVVRSIK